MAEPVPGSLSVVRPAASGADDGFETFIKITADGTVTAFNGHVDLGTGIRTALGQIVAEELDVSFARVMVVLGDTSRVPNQGPTIASETIQIAAVPLRRAVTSALAFGCSPSWTMALTSWFAMDSTPRRRWYLKLRPSAPRPAATSALLTVSPANP